MNAAGDYSAAYCILHTDSEHKGHGMVLQFLLPYFFSILPSIQSYSFCCYHLSFCFLCLELSISHPLPLSYSSSTPTNSSPPDLHNRARQRTRLCRHNPSIRPHQKSHPRFPGLQLGPNMAPPSQRLPTALDRPRKRRHPSRARRRCERNLGSLG